MVTSTSKRSEGVLDRQMAGHGEGGPVSKKAEVHVLVGGRQGDRTGVLDHWSDQCIVLIINSLHRAVLFPRYEA